MNKCRSNTIKFFLFRILMLLLVCAVSQGCNQSDNADDVVIDKNQPNLFPNPNFEPVGKRTDLARDITIRKAESFITKITKVSEDANVLEITKTDDLAQEFNHITTWIPAKPDAKYKIGFEYMVSDDFKGEIAMMISFLPKTAETPYVFSAKKSDRSGSKWQTLNGIIKAPKAAEQMEILLPYSPKYEYGAIKIKQPFLYAIPAK